MDWITVGICVGIFYIGLIIGLILQKWIASRRSYSGAIKIIQNPDKTVFSLELDEDPDTIALMDEVIFKVVASEPDRE